MRVQKIPTLQQTYTGYAAKLILEDDSVFDGIGFGYPSEVAGEVVFNTGMVGYTETLTDPSYRGQILCMTYPLVGNYGVPSFNIKDEYGLPKFFESDKIQVKALLIHDLSDIASHWSCTRTLDQWLYEEKIPGIYGIDTRALTKKLRVHGVMMGAVVVSENAIDEARLKRALSSAKYEGLNFMPEVSTSEPKEYGDKSKDCIVVLDTGVKYSIIRNIIRTGYRVVRLPWDATYEQVMSYNPKGVVISNGPGDPKVCTDTIKTASKLIKESTPTLGICLGNQILALAGGANTYKLKFGHRGQNKPCVDRRNNQVYVTSQNHGYGIDPKTLGKTGFKVWFENADDDTVEGIEHKSKPIIAVQFHPEASPGPYDCMYVFDRFKEIIGNGVKPEPAVAAAATTKAAKARPKKKTTKIAAKKKKKKEVRRGAKR
ncbi:carbamoyl-phosphate synthase small chain [Candidatus Nitrososphaera gargensis Ga9.2]|uniref:Carbamoyl phosphate synthase small chain n=1 Tax=Nitrososphaera gargensis (strain Ga9.2) TaxID=1237085 RepID=K0IKW0_NITGG|nr:glutamine-hydrolyzing carbamoyl-phosphate synthase small subunit [Candidatus Nitrososphaera gargensis]AFU59177.1 carbamoyl-phosphate synthase small chain [Candidatus Nitrososphaera gargensis Ga9.2]